MRRRSGFGIKIFAAWLVGLLMGGGAVYLMTKASSSPPLASEAPPNTAAAAASPLPAPAPLPAPPTSVPQTEAAITPASPPPAPVVSARPAYPVAAAPADLVPVRAYLRSTEIPPQGVGAYGIVALHARPTEATSARLTMACTAFITALERQADLPSSVALGDQMLTIWPLDDPAATEAKADKCNYVLDHYDIYSADSAMKDAAKQKADFRGRGPFLIGWSPSDTRGKPDKLVLVIDMSVYTTQADFEHAFRQWKEKIVQNPELWRHGWSLENLRLVIRDFADKYGRDILFAAHLSDGSGKKN